MFILYYISIFTHNNCIAYVVWIRNIHRCQSNNEDHEAGKHEKFAGTRCHLEERTTCTHIPSIPSYDCSYKQKKVNSNIIYRISVNVA